MTVNTDDSPRESTATRRRRFSPGRLLSELLLDVLALGGVVCIAAVIAAVVFDITLIMFKTGSMSPTIPTGALAVVREIPASEAHVGDVVTVDRQDQLPVTHRITAISTEPSGVTTIRMKGDANDTEDPYPYTVSTVRKVIWSIPELGFFVAKASRPPVLAAVTLAMALLVTWAFWPHRRSSGVSEEEK